MDKKTFCIRVAVWTAVIAAVLIAVIGLCFGKQIETTLFGEISKWIVMSAAVIGILEGFIFMGVGGILYHFWYEKKHEDKEG